MSDYTREEVKASARTAMRNAEVLMNGDDSEQSIAYRLVTQNIASSRDNLLATMDALTAAEAENKRMHIVCASKGQEKFLRYVKKQEARIVVALAVLERKVKSWDDVKEAASILKGERDE
jgi:hypothetical protein